MSPEYFEYNENKEIFLKWQENADIDYVRSCIHTTLHSYLDSLLSKIYLPPIEESKEKRLQFLNDCIVHMRERWLRNLEAKKKELIATESEMGGQMAGLKKQKEQGIEEAKQLKQLFDMQGHRWKSKV